MVSNLFRLINGTYSLQLFVKWAWINTLNLIQQSEGEITVESYKYSNSWIESFLLFVCEIVTGIYVDVVSDWDIVNVMISISPFLAGNNVAVIKHTCWLVFMRAIWEDDIKRNSLIVYYLFLLSFFLKGENFLTVLYLLTRIYCCLLCCVWLIV